MEAINSLGINAKLLIAQIINFVVLLLLLKKFLYGPIVKMLDKRSQTIEKSLNDAKRIEEDLAKTEERNRKATAEAQAEAKKLIEKAKESASTEAKKIVGAAEKRALEIKDKTVAEITREKESAKLEIRAETAELIAMATEKVSEKRYSEKEDGELINKIITEIE